MTSAKQVWFRFIFIDVLTDQRLVNGETLFREMSLSTRMLSVYMEGDEGREYLRSTVLPLVTSIASIDQSLEVNPKAQTIEKKVDIKANLEKICEISQVFLDKVLSSANSYPMFVFEHSYRLFISSFTHVTEYSGTFCCPLAKPLIRSSQTWPTL